MNHVLPLFLFVILWWISGSRRLNMQLREVHRSIVHELNDSHTVFSAETTEHGEAEFVNDSTELDTKQARRFRLLLVVVLATAFILVNVTQVA